MVVIQASLWRHADFRRLWAGQTVSDFGSTITREALPYAAVLALGATPAQMGLLAAAGSAPVLLVGLLAGAWTDRLRRRPLMLAADVGRALLLGSIPLAAALGRLHLPQLFVVAGLAGTLGVLFDVAYVAFLPSLVRREQLGEANSKLDLSGALAEAGAPGLAGLLVQTLTAPAAILLDALSFLWSALMLARIRTPEARPLPPEQGRHLGKELLEGLRLTLGQPLLRAFALSAGTSGFFGNFFAALYALFALRTLGLTAALVGLTVTMGGAGEFLGAALARPLARRFGLGPTILGATAFGGLVSLLIPLAGGPALLAAGMLIAAQLGGDAAGAVQAIHTTTVRQAVVPDRLLGRVAATSQLLGEGVAPLGALAGGLLAGAIGVRPAVYVATLGGMFGLLWLLRSPLSRLRELPQQEPAGDYGV